MGGGEEQGNSFYYTPTRSSLKTGQKQINCGEHDFTALAPTPMRCPFRGTPGGRASSAQPSLRHSRA